MSYHLKQYKDLLKLKKIEEKIEQGKAQAIRYAQGLADEVKDFAPDFNPQKWVIVSLGFERVVWEKAPDRN